MIKNLKDLHGIIHWNYFKMALSNVNTVRILQIIPVTPYNTRYLVEVAGVEPASEIKIQKTSTHIVCYNFNLKLPNKHGKL